MWFSYYSTTTHFYVTAYPNPDCIPSIYRVSLSLSHPISVCISLRVSFFLSLFHSHSLSQPISLCLFLRVSFFQSLARFFVPTLFLSSYFLALAILFVLIEYCIPTSCKQNANVEWLVINCIYHYICTLCI